jgi:histidyl-tRNA synthetase
MKLPTDNYKGVRDFYPEDFKVQEYIFTIWKDVMRSFGYEQYDASLLEDSEIYKAKSGEEIVDKQAYTFTDKGGREVSLRPEMTPTVARMIAAKSKTTSFPVRWFSIPNLFRYERPQKGRLREHWQLNVDLFGISSINADVEIIEIAETIMTAFGLSDQQYTIKINDRKAINKSLADIGLNDIEANQIIKLLDKKDKIDDFDQKAKEIVGRDFVYNPRKSEEIEFVISELKKRGISNIEYDPNLVRGFDYYTGIIFEIFDNSKENPRSIFGGGRYDDLVSVFSDEGIPAVGFGMGDVVIKDVLESYDLIPNFEAPADIYICVLDEVFVSSAAQFAETFRAGGANTVVDYSNKKVGDQIKKADKKEIPFVVCVGENEIDTEKVVVKNVKSGKEKKMKIDKVAEYVLKQMFE